MSLKKIMFILIWGMVPSAIHADNGALFANEKIEISFINSYRYTKSQANLSEIVSNQQGQNYSLNLWGIGFKYYPVKRLFFEASSKSLVKRTIIGTYTPTPGGTTNLLVPEFQIRTISFNYQAPIKKGIEILGILGISQVKSMEEREGIGENHWANYSTWIVGTGVKRELTPRASFGVSVLYDFEKKVKYIKSVGEQLNVDITPISIETILSFSF